MLLYIGSQEDYNYLQELSDKLQQPICIVPAPEEPIGILASVKEEYSYYIVNIGSYMEKKRELIYALKQLVGKIEGDLILLAVNMTVETPIISELMYAGFNNIIFGTSTSRNNVSSSNTRLDHEPMCAAIRDTESISNNCMDFGQRPTEPMGMRTVSTPTLGSNLSLVTAEQKAEKKGLANKVLAIACGCAVIVIIAMVVIYQVFLNTQDNLLKVPQELASLNEGGDRPKISPVASAVASPEETVEPQVKEPIVEETVPPLATSNETATEELVTSDATTEDSKFPAKEVKGIALAPSSSLKPKRKTKPSIPIKSIMLPSSIRMVTGGRVTIEVEYLPTNADDTDLIWSSSDPKVATVKNGTIVALKSGQVYIMVKTNNVRSRKCQVIIADQ